MNLPLLIFDIETVPDIEASSRIYTNLPANQSQDELEKTLASKRKEDLGHDFPRLPLHEVVCLSGLWVSPDNMKLFSLSQENNSEQTILEKFIKSIEQHNPTLVSWNGKAFDIPVLTYRAMKHHLTAPRLFDQGWHDNDTKYYNYQNRYHLKHTDLMDVFARFHPKYFQKLDLISKFLDLPGKQDGTGEQIDGHAVKQLVKDKAWDKLTGYCESDVLNTWLIYLRWVLLIGKLTHDQHDDWLQRTQNYLQLTHKHHQSFLTHS